MRLRISARKSDLARLQAYTVGEALIKKNPALKIEYRFKESLGDKNLTDPLWQIPEKGVFTQDFYGELLKDETDLVVHSWKDLPTELTPDTFIAATMKRADQRDLLLLKKSHFKKIKDSAHLQVFSSSPRREYNLTNFFKTHLPFSLKSVNFESVRGNIPTRMRKLLENPEVDGLIVAKAALDRLLTAEQAEFSEVKELLRSYMNQLEWAALPLSINPNAAAQGALAVEILKSRQDLKELLSSIHDQSTFECAQKERSLLSSFGGGCHQKIGVAVLHRPYGEITFLKGLTDAGQILDSHTLAPTQAPPRFDADKLWSGETQTQRVPRSAAPIEPRFNGYFIARAEAWVDGLKNPSYVWTAGTKTWKNLAQKGIWVHGCSEGLGEQEHSLIEILAGQEIQWLKLSHDQGYEENSSVMPLYGTYSLQNSEPLAGLQDKESFFWNSGSQFLLAAKQAPEIIAKHHGCGPGNTYKVIRKYLEEHSSFERSRLNIFLDQNDWRQRCTK